jgi:hypothetical protein
MPININAYVEVNETTADYSFMFNGSPVDHKIINEFADGSGHVYESLITVDAKEKNNQLSIVGPNLTEGFIQIRELFLDEIKMDHVLLLISQLQTDQLRDGTQLRSPGEIIITFDTPVWSWWCAHLRSIEVIENVGYRVRSFE